MSKDFQNLVFAVDLTIYFFICIAALTYGTRLAKSGHVSADQVWLRVASGLVSVALLAVVYMQFHSGGLNALGYVLGVVGAFCGSFCIDFPKRPASAAHSG